MTKFRKPLTCDGPFDGHDKILVFRLDISVRFAWLHWQIFQKNIVPGCSLLKF